MQSSKPRLIRTNNSPRPRLSPTDLLIDALADDVARAREEAIAYRAVAQEAIHTAYELRQDCQRARAEAQALREELRRYVANRVRT